MDVYLNTVCNKNLKKIAYSNERKKDKYKIKKMCKSDLVEYIIDKKILDISMVHNMRTTDLDYFIDYNQLNVHTGSNKSMKYLEVLESKKYNLYLNIEENEYIENALSTLSIFLPNDLINMITGYNTHYCSNAVNCDTILKHTTVRHTKKTLQEIYEYNDYHQCCICLYNNNKILPEYYRLNLPYHTIYDATYNATYDTLNVTYHYVNRKSCVDCMKQSCDNMK
jgi:hypothetical protein